jgi:uncharacterized protein (DUF169 family)
MENWMNIGKALEEILRLQTYPLAIKLVRDETEFPERTRRPEQKLALCQALGICRKFGWTMGVTGEDSICQGSNMAYGWDTTTDESGLENFFLFGGYVSDEAGAKRIVKNKDRLKPGQYGGVVISPLTRTKIVPDVILVYAHPAQVMRLIHGALYKNGERLTCKLSGIASSCGVGIIRTFNTKQCQVAILGTGDRAFAGAQDDEMIFSIPPAQAEDIIIGMRAHRLTKYPIPVSLQMPPPFPEY